MDPDHRRLILSNLNELSNLIDLDSLVPCLMQRRVFTKAMLEDIYDKEKNSDRKEAFLTELQTRGPMAFENFLKSLEESGHQAAIKLLTQTDNLLTGSNDESIKSRNSNLENDISSHREGEEVILKENCKNESLQKFVIPAKELKSGPNIYKMTSKLRGLCLIINNVEFYDEKLYRHGADVDAFRLDTLFKQLGYIVYIRKNLRAVEMINTLTLFSEEFGKCDADSSVVIISSHGERNIVYGTDMDHVLLEEIYQLFDNYKCPYLREKPKMFFIQACQGNSRDIGVTCLPANQESADAVPKLSPKSIKRLPVCSDMSISQSTVYGYISIRNHTLGSWFFNQLVHVFIHEAHNTELTMMLKHIDTKVKAMVTNEGEKQATEHTTKGWDKELYFNPGLTL